jgi:hypothetical protein
VRVYLRGRRGGVSVGVVGALVLGVLLAAAWFWLAVVIAAVAVVAVLGLFARALIARWRR